MFHKKHRHHLSFPYIAIWSTVTLMTVACFLPILNTLAVSLSSSVMVAAGKVQFLPQGFTMDSYREIIADGQFFTAFLVSVRRVLLGGID